MAAASAWRMYDNAKSASFSTRPTPSASGILTFGGATS